MNWFSIMLMPAVAAIALPAQAEPFGITKGARLGDLPVVAKVDGYGLYGIYQVKAPKPDSAMTTYEVELALSTGVCKVTATGVLHANDESGTVIRDVYRQYKADLTRQYGDSKEYDFVQTWSKLTALDQSALAFSNHQRVLFSRWNGESTSMPADIKSIELRVQANAAHETYMTVTYFFSNYDVCQSFNPPPPPIPVPPVPSGPPHASAPNHAGSYIAGNWTYPSSESAANAYPEKALQDEVEGRVTIDCAVDASGKLTSCDVVSETPLGYGFGAATVKIFLEGAYVDPASVQGGVVSGCRRKFTYVWAL